MRHPAVREKPLRRGILSRGVSFWAVAAIGVLAAATNAAASPLYRVYQLQFRFSATTLTLLFAVYVVVLLVTLVFVGSASDYLGRRPVMLAALALGAAACGLFLVAHGVGLMFAGRALQGVAVGLISGSAGAALLDLRPERSITPIVSSAAPTGGQASLALQLLHSQNLLWGGVLIFLLTGLGAAASAAVARKSPAGVMLGGCVTLIVGALVTFASIETGTPLVLFVGAALAGLGFGSAFVGAYRATVARAASDDRAGLITAIYIVSYLATGVPVVIGGVATSKFGLHKTALVYSAAVAVLAAPAAILLIRQMAGGRSRRATDHPDVAPGSGTVPPCPPISPRLEQART
jgi:predicted MFS family arabinose efflux permease